MIKRDEGSAEDLTGISSFALTVIAVLGITVSVSLAAAAMLVQV